MNVTLFGEVAVTLIVIMDPIGNVPIFLGVTRRLDRRARNRAALVATATAFGLITVFALVGQQVLDYLGVSVAALQGSGGLLLLLVALELLTGSPDDGALDAGTEHQMSIAMVPLGTPLLAGPGVIVATIVFAGNSDGRGDVAAIAAGIVVVSLVSYLAMRFAGIIDRVVRPAGVLLLSRVAGILLAAIAVQMIATSVTTFVRDARLG